MERIRDRADIIALVARSAASPACRRACLTGKVEVLGGFSELPPSDKPGWILQITAKHGTVFLIGVIPNDLQHRYQVWTLEEVPWHLWVGRPLAGAAYSVYQGDRPVSYDLRRDQARAKLKLEPASCV